ncbi:DUF1320 domain-containing protein [Flavobacterium alkalisoli]|uniref:DUF1320 domain-containing protein n=1 Tax=Flavobacterium alkalisoli TaxID=2602769 RepID=A0A5B9FZ25_9FLAO|nr:phage protein Gp36 family protein [Flavobacterium alkalisoli]QEE51048.1 DUF1320 domain-containing protein [Flavobacterium alkalisoli]
MARFLNDTDYTAIVRNEIKAALLSNYNDAKLHTAENMAVSQIKKYIAGKHPVDKVFVNYDSNDPGATDGRDAYIVMLTIDLTLYHLYSSTAPNLIPKHRSERYGDALEWLKGVAKGDFVPDLPLYENESGDEMINIKIRSARQSEDQKW